MVPPDLDIDTLVDDLRDDGFAFLGAIPAVVREPGGVGDFDALQAEIAHARENGFERASVIVSPQPFASAPDYRDLAHEVAERLESQLVIVRTPTSATVVAPELPRARVERAEYHCAAEPDYARGVEQVVHELGESSSTPGLIGGIALPLVVICAAMVAWFRARRSRS